MRTQMYSLHDRLADETRDSMETRKMRWAGDAQKFYRGWRRLWLNVMERWGGGALRVRREALREKERGEQEAPQTDIYLALCSKHGPFLDYPHGHDGRLDCPQCSDEARAQRAA